MIRQRRRSWILFSSFLLCGVTPFFWRMSSHGASKPTPSHAAVAAMPQKTGLRIAQDWKPTGAILYPSILYLAWSNRPQRIGDDSCLISDSPVGDRFAAEPKQKINRINRARPNHTFLLVGSSSPSSVPLLELNRDFFSEWTPPAATGSFTTTDVLGERFSNPPPAWVSADLPTHEADFQAPFLWKVQSR